MLAIIRHHHFLLQELVLRDLKARYTGSLLGLFWSVLNPLLQLVLYTVVFSVALGLRFGRADSTGRFAEFLFCALLPWIAIQESTIRSASCLIDQSNLIKKLRFPLEIIPLSIALSAFIHQLIGSTVFILVLALTGSLTADRLPLLAPFLIAQALIMYGLGLLFSTLNTFFRDFAHILGVGFQFLFWTTPIVYAKENLSVGFQLALNLNPLTHMVDLYRYAMVGGPVPSVPGVLYWVLSCVAVYLFGRFVLKRTRSELVDLI